MVCFDFREPLRLNLLEKVVTSQDDLYFIKSERLSGYSHHFGKEASEGHLGLDLG
jgi:hypothetical protein